MSILNPLSTTNAQIDIKSGNGPINVGTDAVGKAITIGNATGNTGVTINSGTSGLAHNSTGAISLAGASGVSINASAGTINIGDGNDNRPINIGNGTSSRAITIGNLTGSTALVLRSADVATFEFGALTANITQAISMTSANSNIVISSNQITTIDAGGNLELNSSAGVINIGNDNVNQNINIGTNGNRTITVGNTGTTGVVLNAGAAGVKVPAFTSIGVVGNDATGLLGSISPATAGYVLTSNGTGSAPTFQAIPSSSYITWQLSSAGPVNMAVGNGYINYSGAPLTFNLPTTAAVGTIVAVQGGGNLWSIAQAAGQQIYFPGGATTSGTGGSVTAATNYDVIYLICVVANTTWAYNGGFGNYDVV